MHAAAHRLPYLRPGPLIKILREHLVGELGAAARPARGRGPGRLGAPGDPQLPVPVGEQGLHRPQQGLVGGTLGGRLGHRRFGYRCWEDVELGNATIVIANTRTMMGNRYVVEKDTKSLAGERDLPLPAPVLAALKAFRALQTEEKLALGEAYVASGHVLVHEAGDAFTVKQLRRRAYRLMEFLGLRRVRLYDARSSCFTFLADNGVPDRILARWAGHTKVKTTKRWYVKPDVTDLRGATTTWDGLHWVAVEGQA
ncbi:site-specific integrase [Streptomyces celluloflavus]|uniref:site-specific integrase n=1 Tax=Streptomyces celluloflavus TaxID=58344 RepID=UPI00345F6F74|nr:site-specific integrase [Streptomyces celluloflavus]